MKVNLLFFILFLLWFDAKSQFLEEVLTKDYVLEHKIKSIRIAGDSSLIFQNYDKKGQLTFYKSEEYKNGELLKEDINKIYNNYGVESENFTLLRNGTVYSSNFKYLRDGKGNLTYKLLVNNNNVDTLMSYENDEKGQVIKQILIDKSSNFKAFYLLFYLDDQLIQKSYIAGEDNLSFINSDVYSYKEGHLLNKKKYIYEPSNFGNPTLTFEGKYYYENSRITRIEETDKEGTINEHVIDYFLSPFKWVNENKKLAKKSIAYPASNSNLFDEKDKTPKERYGLKNNLIEIIGGNKNTYSLSYQFYK